jgi:hypothetical protein
LLYPAEEQETAAQSMSFCLLWNGMYDLSLSRMGEYQMTANTTATFSVDAEP